MSYLKRLCWRRTRRRCSLYIQKTNKKEEDSAESELIIVFEKDKGKDKKTKVYTTKALQFKDNA